VAEERELVGLAAIGRLHVEVAELVGSAPRRRVDEPLAVGRDVRPGPIQRVLGEHRGRGVYAVARRWNAQHVAGPERHATVGDDQEFPAVGQPGGRYVHVHRAEIQTVTAEIVVVRDGDFLAHEPTVLDGADMDIEVTGGPRRDVGEPGPIRREGRVHVDLVVVGQRADLTRRHFDDLELDRAASIVRDIRDPTPVGRPGRHRVVLAGVCEFARTPRRRIDDPDRPAHRNRDHGAVGGPRRRPRRRTRRRCQVVVVHVEALFGGRIGRRTEGRMGQDTQPERGGGRHDTCDESIACRTTTGDRMFSMPGRRGHRSILIRRNECVRRRSCVALSHPESVRGHTTRGRCPAR
jgi:hypothetical protein